jgi:predicted solute-binding protein
MDSRLRVDRVDDGKRRDICKTVHQIVGYPFGFAVSSHVEQPIEANAEEGWKCA